MWTWLRTRSRSQRIAIVAALTVGYALLQLALRPSMGGSLGAAVIAPVALAGWWFGARPALLLALFALPLNVGLAMILGIDMSGQVATFIPGEVALVLVALGSAKVAQLVQAQVAARRTIAESEARFRTLFENVTIGLYRTTPSGQVLLANPALLRMLGYASLDELARKDLNSSNDNVVAYSRAEWMARIEADGEIVGLETVWSRSDGSVIEVRENARAVHNERGDVLHYEGTVEDITERKRAEVALRKSEELYRVLADNASDLIARAAVDQISPWYVSPSCKAILGYEPSEMMVVDAWRALVDATALGVIEDTRTRMFETLSPARCELKLRHKEGRDVWVETVMTPVVDKDGLVVEVISVCRDVTERKAMDAMREAERDAIARNERLTSLGTLVAGVAHEINNPLTYVAGNIEVALLDIDDAARAMHAAGIKEPDLAATARGLQSALGGAERIGHVTRALKAVARQRRPGERERTDLRAVVQNVDALLRVGIPPHVALVLEDGDAPAWAWAQAAELHQVVLNLAQNAIDAVAERGGGTVWLSVASSRDGPALTVRDDGPGIPAEAMPKLFVPFYTTKANGTGLGLPIVHGIVRDHGGEIVVESPPGQGASFTVRLPPPAAAECPTAAMAKKRT